MVPEQPVTDEFALDLKITKVLPNPSDPDNPQEVKVYSRNIIITGNDPALLDTLAAALAAMARYLEEHDAA